MAWGFNPSRVFLEVFLVFIFIICFCSSTGIIFKDPSRASTSRTDPSSSDEELTDEQRKAIADIAPDIPDHEEDYLDLTLEEEAKFIQKYKVMLASLSG